MDERKSRNPVDPRSCSLLFLSRAALYSVPPRKLAISAGDESSTTTMLPEGVSACGGNLVCLLLGVDPFLSEAISVISGASAIRIDRHSSRRKNWSYCNSKVVRKPHDDRRMKNKSVSLSREYFLSNLLILDARLDNHQHNFVRTIRGLYPH